MSKKTCKNTYTRFVYSIIDFFANRCKLPFDVSSYIKNDENQKCQFAYLKISKYIQRYSKRESKNRLFLTISLNDTGTIRDGRIIIRSIVDELLEEFLKSSCIDILRQIDKTSFIEVFSSREKSSLTDYLIIVFNVSKCSSIECIISTDSVTSKLIERDDEGDVVEFNSRLHSNLRSFEKNL